MKAWHCLSQKANNEMYCKKEETKSWATAAGGASRDLARGALKSCSGKIAVGLGPLAAVEHAPARQQDEVIKALAYVTAWLVNRQHYLQQVAHCLQTLSNWPVHGKRIWHDSDRHHGSYHLAGAMKTMMDWTTIADLAGWGSF